MYTFKIIIYQSFLEVWKRFLIVGCKKIQLKIHQDGWKYNYFKSSDVSILGHVCGVSQFPQSNDRYRKLKIYPPHMWEVMRVKRVTYF